MRRRLASLGALAALALAGCGGSTVTVTRTTTAPAPHSEAGCNPAPGQGHMGVCAPAPKKSGAVERQSGKVLIPDVSEFQACALHSEAIFRVYEAGLDREDFTARCHASELTRLHAWAAVYSFLRRSRSCTYEADRTLAIVRKLPVAVQVVIADAETGLRGGFVACFLHEVERGGYPAREYTCPGCGDEQVGPVWIAAYPFRPPGKWIAHQFADNVNCRGVFGDCSIDEGILAVRRVDHGALEARIRTLQRYLQRYGCRRREHAHETLGPRCKRWKREGDEAHKRLGK